MKTAMQTTLVLFGLCGSVGVLLSCKAKSTSAIPTTAPTTVPAAAAVEPRPRTPQRFVLVEFDVVEDTETGFLWQRDGIESGKMNFYEAAEYAAKQRLGDMDGWRVPTRAELKTILPADESPWTNSHYEPIREAPGDFQYYWTCEWDRATGEANDYAYVYLWRAQGGGNNCYASKNRAYVRCINVKNAKPGKLEDMSTIFVYRGKGEIK